MLFELEGYEDDLDYRSVPLSPKTPCSEALGIIVKKFKLPGKVSEYYLVEVSEENEGKAMDLFPWKTYLSVKVFNTEVIIGDTILRHFTWSTELHEGGAVCKAKGVPSFLSYFKTTYWSGSGESNPRPLPPVLQSSALPTELILPRQKKRQKQRKQ